MMKWGTRYDLGPSKSIEVVLHICAELLSDVELEIVTDKLIKMIDANNKQTIQRLIDENNKGEKRDA